jgi:hypothetical protein
MVLEQGGCDMVKKHFTVPGLVLTLLLMAGGLARANVITAAPATVDCTGFNLCVTLEFLAVGTPLEVDYSFTLTPTSGPAITVPGMINFTPVTFTQTVCTNGTWPGSPLTAPYTVTGTASLPSEPPLTGFNPFDITFNGTTSTTIELMCSTGTGCPATIGFWKNTKKHPFPSSVQSSGLNIGGVTYSAANLLTILNANGGNAVVILGRQLVGALLNLAAGAKDNMAADTAIADAESLLSMNSLNLLTSFVDPSSTLGQALLADEAVLDHYNSSDFGTCSEGSGLTLGTK